jgi:hypothetical protein
MLGPFLNLHQLHAAKKDMQNQASQQTFGCSYFVRVLQSKQPKCLKSRANKQTKNISGYFLAKSTVCITRLFYIQPIPLSLQQAQLCSGCRGATLKK